MPRGEKRQYYVTFKEATQVPCDDGPFVLQWKRGKKECNKGVIKNLNCVDNKIAGSLFNVIMLNCTLIKSGKSYSDKVMKFTLSQVRGSGKKVKYIPFGISFVNLAEYVDCATKREVVMEMKTKKGALFSCTITVQCLGGVEVSEVDRTEVLDEKKGASLFERSTESVSEESTEAAQDVASTSGQEDGRDCSVVVEESAVAQPEPIPVRRKRGMALVGYTREESDETGEEEEAQSEKTPENIFSAPVQLKSLTELAMEDTDADRQVIDYRKSNNNIDLREVLDAVRTVKGHFDDMDSFVVLLKKWWSDGDPHYELSLLPMSMDTYEECIWLLLALKDVGGKIRKQEVKMSSRDLQITDVYEQTYKRAVKVASFKLEGILNYLVDTPVFDSQKSNYEEGIGCGVAEMLNGFYECACKIESRVAERLTRQIVHFIAYYLIEEMVSRNRVCGTKGFQLSFFVSCVQSSVSRKFPPLAKFMKYFDPMTEVCRMLTMPMSLEIIQLKDEIFPTLTTGLMARVLNLFRLDQYNLNRVPKSVFDYLLQHDDFKPTPSRYDILK